MDQVSPGRFNSVQPLAELLGQRPHTLATSPAPNPSATSLLTRLCCRVVCKTALMSGRPRVMDSVLERYMKEIAGARCEGSVMTAWRETKTADWATPVPKPLQC